MTANKKIWWEKTVEYAFVRSAHFLSVSPLDGNHEQAGDAILSNKENKFYLIEFKKEDSNQEDEIDKYLRNRKISGMVIYYFKFREYVLDFIDIDEKKQKLKLKEFLSLSKSIFKEYLVEDNKKALKDEFDKKNIKAYQVDECWLNLCLDNEELLRNIEENIIKTHDLITLKNVDNNSLVDIKDYIEEKIEKLEEVATKSFHFIVYGKNNGEKDLQLCAKQYLDYLQEKGEVISIEQFNKKEFIEKIAVGQDEFLEYVHEIVSLKEGKDLDVIGKSGSSSSAFANVLAINDKGESCSLLDIVNSQAYQEKYKSVNSLKKNVGNSISNQEVLNKLQKKTQELSSKTKPQPQLGGPKRS